MKYEGNATCLNIHASTRKRLREVVETLNFSSSEELINYLLDRYFEEKNENTERKEGVRA